MRNRLAPDHLHSILHYRNIGKSMPLAFSAIETAADHILSALTDRKSIAPLTDAPQGLSLPDAYRISRAVTARRIARGEHAVGRKIGFTNRTIWAEYGVHHPIDGPMYDTTVSHVSGKVAVFSLASFVEPRIEPEIVLGITSMPTPDMDEAALMSCIGWMAHGFEIVQSLFPGWRFSGADCVAAFGLHGALICGPKREILPAERASTLDALSRFSITLHCNGNRMDTGQAANVLGGPVSALLHLVKAIAQDPEATPLEAGDIITTGTVTRAFPVSTDERWTTGIAGIQLPGMDVTFMA
jgi:2-oxo-3-hexenedioate decarboxylase